MRAWPTIGADPAPAHDSALRRHRGHGRPSPVRRRKTSSSERRPARSSPRRTSWSRSQIARSATSTGVAAALDHVVPGLRLAHRARRRGRVPRPARASARPGGALKRVSSRHDVARRASAGVPHATSRPWSTIATRSHSCSASSIAWVVSTTVTPRVAQLAHERPRRRAACGSMPGRRLVEEDELGPADERERERQALLLPARHAPHERVLRLPQPDEVEEPVGVVGRVVVRGEQPEGLEGADTGIEAALLEHHADPGAQARAVTHGVETEDPHGPAVGRAVALEDLDRGGLAGAVGPEEAEHLAGGDGERQPVDRRVAP